MGRMSLQIVYEWDGVVTDHATYAADLPKRISGACTEPDLVSVIQRTLADLSDSEVPGEWCTNQAAAGYLADVFGDLATDGMPNYGGLTAAATLIRIMERNNGELPESPEDMADLRASAAGVYAMLCSLKLL